MTTKQRRYCAALGLLVLTGMLLWVCLRHSSAPVDNPEFLLVPLSEKGDPPIAFGTQAADRFLNTLRADPQLKVSGLGLTVITHGWLEREDWCRDLALALRDHTPDPWLFTWYDWKKQSQHVNPTEVARLAKYTLGPALGQQIREMGLPLTHVHLIGHSAGSWLVNEAARDLAQDSDLPIHLTFLDAYVPIGWNADELGNVYPDLNDSQRPFWADHYLTHDHTLVFTHQTLMHAHNVDLTAIAHGLNQHRFPFYWYHATVTGSYPRALYADRPLISQTGDTPYGFPLTREAGPNNWQNALLLDMGNNPLKLIVLGGDTAMELPSQGRDLP